ncbi:MAG TPA: hypothetical protein VHX11_11695 [Acidobacteriaceae bacterium]|jgi:hypothetical protein|nr:hypothetical protein [Acidobacteriaceae bacterium]
MKTLAAFAVLVLCSGAAFGQCNSVRVSAHDEMRASSAVIVGTVTAAVPVTESWDFLDGVSYNVHVDSVLHGHINRSDYRVFSENTPTAFGMMVGKHYVLYLQPKYDRYQVEECGNSHATEEPEISTKQLAKGF